MLNESDIRPGVRVTGLLGVRNGLGGLITGLRRDRIGGIAEYDVHWDDGTASVYGSLLSCQLEGTAVNPPETNKPLTDAELYVGMRVKCISSGSRLCGKTGYIKELDLSSCADRITLSWDDGAVDNIGWTFAESFCRLDDTPPTLKRPYPDGCNCRKCNGKNPYAEPNQKDGSYLCYECR